MLEVKSRENAAEESLLSLPQHLSSVSTFDTKKIGYEKNIMSGHKSSVAIKNRELQDTYLIVLYEQTK